MPPVMVKLEPNVALLAGAVMLTSASGIVRQVQGQGYYAW
jgi:hypothetical protein